MPYNPPPSGWSVLGSTLLGIGQDEREKRRRQQEIDLQRADRMREFALEHEGGEGAPPTTERTLTGGSMPTFAPPSFGAQAKRAPSPLAPKPSAEVPPMFRGRGVGMAGGMDVPPVPKLSAAPEAKAVTEPLRVTEPDSRFQTTEVAGSKFYFKPGSVIAEEADARAVARARAGAQAEIDLKRGEQERLGALFKVLIPKAQKGDQSAIGELAALGFSGADYKSFFPTPQGQVVQMRRPGDTAPGMYSVDPDTGAIISRLGDAPKDPYQAQEEAAQKAEVRLRAQRAAALIQAVQKIRAEAGDTNDILFDPEEHARDQARREAAVIAASDFGSLDAAIRASKETMGEESAPESVMFGPPPQKPIGLSGHYGAFSLPPAGSRQGPAAAPPAPEETSGPAAPPPIPRAPVAGGRVGGVSAATPPGVDAGRARAMAAELSGLGEGDVDAALDQANVSPSERAYIKTLLAGG